jgi:hypothetical protein
MSGGWAPAADGQWRSDAGLEVTAHSTLTVALAVPLRGGVAVTVSYRLLGPSLCVGVHALCHTASERRTVNL